MAQESSGSPGSHTWGALAVGCAVCSFGQLEGHRGCLSSALQGCRAPSPAAKPGSGGEAPRPAVQRKLQLPVLPSPWRGLRGQSFLEAAQKTFPGRWFWRAAPAGEQRPCCGRGQPCFPGVSVCPCVRGPVPGLTWLLSRGKAESGSA